MEATTDHPRRDGRLPLLLSAYAVLLILANIGSIAAPSLVKHQPALLLALSSRIRHLLFAIPAGINTGAYIVVPILRMGVAAAVCYALGVGYGDRGMGWLERQLGNDRPATLRWLERAVDRAGWLAVFLMPGSNVVCGLVGMRRMRPTRFAALVVAGTVFRLAWVWWAAKEFRHQLDTALVWINRYQWPLVVGFFALTIFQSLLRSARSTPPAAVPETAPAITEHPVPELDPD